MQKQKILFGLVKQGVSMEEAHVIVQRGGKAMKDHVGAGIRQTMTATRTHEQLTNSVGVCAAMSPSPLILGTTAFFQACEGWQKQG